MSLDEGLEMLTNWLRAASILHSRFSDPSTGMFHEQYVIVGSVNCFVLQLIDAESGVSTPRRLDGAALASCICEGKLSYRSSFLMVRALF